MPRIEVTMRVDDLVWSFWSEQQDPGASATVERIQDVLTEVEGFQITEPMLPAELVRHRAENWSELGFNTCQDAILDLTK
jgi:hypothetical protein